MRLNNFLNESYRLKDLVQIKINFKDADFWVNRRDDIDMVGSPSKKFNKEHYGVKVIRTNVLDSGYLFYAIMNLHSQGYFKKLAKGTISVVNITVKDLENIRLG